MKLIQGYAHDALLQRRDPVQIPAASQPRDLCVELGAMLLDSLHEIPCERLSVAERLCGRLVGHLPLVEGEDRGTALIRAAHSVACSPAYARETYSPLRV